MAQIDLNYPKVKSRYRIWHIKKHKGNLRLNNRAVKYGQPDYSYRRPFWLPAVSYYFLAVAVAIIVFFFIWGILHDGGDEAPWIPAGILSSLILIGAVLLRELVLRKTRNRYLAANRQLDYTLSKLPDSAIKAKRRKKFTLEQNANILNQIEEKSDAARVFKRLSVGHFEVFEFCNEYLNFTNKELKKIDRSSPRYLAIRKGRKRVKKLHKYHLLTWAEVESKSHTIEAKNQLDIVGKIESAQKALTVLGSALEYYPKDKSLNSSSDALLEFISRVKMAHRLEQAEMSEFNGNIKGALGQYRDILFFLKKENLSKSDKGFLTEKVSNEINRLYPLLQDDVFEFNKEGQKRIEKQ